MSQEIRKHRRSAASLRDREAFLTVLRRMAADEARAQRVRQLKDAHPDLTWAIIAERVGVTERSAVQWQKTGGMEYANAKKFAELMDVSVDWLWGGEHPAPGDMRQLDRIEDMLRQVAEDVSALRKQADEP